MSINGVPVVPVQNQVVFPEQDKPISGVASDMTYSTHQLDPTVLPPHSLGLALQHFNTVQYHHLARLRSLFPEVSPATLKNLLELCQGDFIRTVDNILYTQRYVGRVPVPFRMPVPSGQSLPPGFVWQAAGERFPYQHLNSVQQAEQVLGVGSLLPSFEHLRVPQMPVYPRFVVPQHRTGGPYPSSRKPEDLSLGVGDLQGGSAADPQKGQENGPVVLSDKEYVCRQEQNRKNLKRVQADEKTNVHKFGQPCDNSITSLKRLYSLIGNEPKDSGMCEGSASLKCPRWDELKNDDVKMDVREPLSVPELTEPDLVCRPEHVAGLMFTARSFEKQACTADVKLTRLEDKNQMPQVNRTDGGLTRTEYSAEVQDDMGKAENWRMCPSPDSPRKPVKSTAVVKYSSVQSFANFALLQCNTDLNLPPSNWLSSSAESYGLQYVPSHSSGFSSFRMAHMFPDCVGEVDVVSDAENIKKLLKIPYSKGPVSMMVHRIENTLLIDEFDIHKHLLRTAETEWEWLKKFFFDHVLKSLSDKICDVLEVSLNKLAVEEKGLFHKNNSRYALQQKSLVSKFLYHSLAVAEPKTQESEIQGDNLQQMDTPVPMPVATAWPPLPEPRPEENLPDPTSNHKFARNVVWTFEDIQMLIGTDMPIFGGTTHPCISLRLRDMSKPISVLTGIDYWLDNLMCNVPELVMCYHLDGIVQKYELIKTEDLPHLENSKFSPKVIRDVAQNILSFLKSNATKAGHTYWLFKGKDDDVVKLYDLTSLCTDVLDDKGQNPFTVPVAMLLYRVARNMKHSSDGRRQQGTIRMLLKNCLALLVKEKYPQIVTSAHYMLSDLYVPADTDPAAPGLDGLLNDEEDCDHAGMEDGSVEEPLSNSSSVPVKALCLSTPDTGTQGGSSSEESKFSSPPPMCGGVEERCKTALQHVASGLQCLQYFDQEEDRQQEGAEKDSQYQSQMNNGKQQSQEPKMARPFQAIPMPYSPLSSHKETEKHSTAASKVSTRKKKREKVVPASVSDKTKTEGADSSPKALLCKSKTETMPTWQQPDSMSWNVHLKTLLYEKACLVYVTLAESDYVAVNYGRSLHYIAHVLRVLMALTSSSSNAGLRSYLLGRAGDCCFMIVQNWDQVDTHREDYAHCTSVDRDIMEEVDKDTAALGVRLQNSANIPLDLIPESINSLEQMLQASCCCYQKALALEPRDQRTSNLQRRLGNIQNELGVLYMNQAAARYKEEMNQQKVQGHVSMFQKLFTQSLHHLEAGVKAFELVHDEANLALLHSNTGRLMRMCAHFHSPDSSDRHSELAGQERHFYIKALSSYQKAVQVLCSRRSNPTIWDTVVWELSTTLFTMATLLQDFPSLGNKSQEEAEREVVEYLMKALKYCDLETPGPRQPIYQFRAATIHHRLASLYHKSYRTMLTDDARRKNALLLSRLHYEKSSRLLLQLEHPSEFLRVQMERVALSEFQAQNASGHSGKLKALQVALDLLLQCRPILKVLQERAQAVRVRPVTRRDEDMGRHISKVTDTCDPAEYETSNTDVGVVTDNDSAPAVEAILNTSVHNPGDGSECCKMANRDVPQSEEELAEQEEERSLVQLLEQRLQFVLRSLTKLCLTKTGGSAKKESSSSSQVYKNLYSMTLKEGARDRVSGLLEMLANVNCALSRQPEVTR